MGRFATPEAMLLYLSWRDHRKNNKPLGLNGYGSLKQWESCQEQLNNNWLALMESVLRPGAWRALVSLLKIRDSHRKLHLKPGGFLVTRARKLRRHWLWSKRQRAYWGKRLRKINMGPLIKETADCRTKYVNALGTTELHVTQLGSGANADAVTLAGEKFDGMLTIVLATLSGGIYSPRATSRIIQSEEEYTPFRPGPRAGIRVFRSTLDSFQPRPPSKMLLLQ